MDSIDASYLSDELIEDRDWLDRLVERAPRLAVLAIISLAWAMTLAWPPIQSTGPLVAGQKSGETIKGYPLQLTLPQTGGIVSLERLIALADAHPVIAALDLLPEPEIEDIASTPVSGSGNGSFSSDPSIENSQFAEAFADFTSSLSASDRADAAAAVAIAAAEGLEPGAFLDLNYDLATLSLNQPASGGAGGTAQYDASDGSLTVTKPLFVDGQDKGSAAIRIEEGAQIFITASSVAEALGPRIQALPSRVATALETGDGFIPFHELRGAGMTVEYDPVSDRISLTMPS